MNRILFILAAIILIPIALLVVAPGIIPVAAYKPRIEAAASAALGRETHVGDDLSFRIFPTTAFHVTDLTIANADGFDGAALASVGKADIGVKLFKLIGGAVEIDRFVLTDPDINLVRAADGSVNWNLAHTDETAAAGDAGPADIKDISLGDVRIVNGRARFRDEAADTTYAAENINLKVLLKSLKEPLEASGTMTLQGQPSKIDLVLTSLADIMRQAPSNLKLDMQVGETTIGADVAIENGETLAYSGPISFDAPDLPAFAALAGTELADAPGFDKLSLSGDVEGGASALRLSNARIGFDEIAAEGALTLDWSGARPKAGGVLSTDKLDLRPYMPPPVETPEGFPAWSTAKMDFSSLRNIDADFDISTNAVYLNDLQIGESRLKLHIADGRMTADIPELAMYGGQGSGQLVVNARGATPSFSGNFDMSAVNAQPMSLDLIKNDNLLGLGSFKFDFTASGASQAAIMSSLDGNGDFDLADGAIKGVNIAKMVRAAAALTEGVNMTALQSAVTTARGANEQTDFSEFLSNFTIADGLVHAPTITLNGPYLTMAGTGTVNLPQQTIDLRLSPRGSTTMDGQGGRTITVPIRVGGTFSKPTIAIDAESLVRSGLQNKLRDVLGGKSGDGTTGDTATDAAAQILDSVLGPKKKTDGTDEKTGAASDADIAKEALGALFGGKKKTTAEDSAEADKDE